MNSDYKFLNSICIIIKWLLAAISFCKLIRHKLVAKFFQCVDTFCSWVVHFRTRITLKDIYFTKNCSLSIFVSYSCNLCIRLHFINSWCILSFHFCSVSVFTYNSYSCCSSNEIFIWCEGYLTCWINSICSFVWNCFTCCTIFKCSRNFIVHWYIFMTRYKCWCTRLRSVLRTCRACIHTCWCNWGYSWSVTWLNSCTICRICYNYFSWVWCSNEVFIWCEGYCTSWIDCICTNCLTILSSWDSCFLSSNELSWIICCWFQLSSISMFICWSTCLWLTLDISWCSRCCSWRYWFIDNVYCTISWLVCYLKTWNSFLIVSIISYFWRNYFLKRLCCWPVSVFHISCYQVNACATCEGYCLNFISCYFFTILIVVAVLDCTSNCLS